jgi:phosphoribosyl 1,2-cyclic phosphodiesterase
MNPKQGLSQESPRMHYASLASGSRGNCHAFCDGERTLLVDAGLSLLQIRRRMEAMGLDPGLVRAVAISHEHSDHIAALPVILRRTDWSLLATRETLEAVARIQGLEVPPGRWIPLEAGRGTSWEGWRIHPFAIPHDAEDPVAFRLEVGAWTGAVVTDLGHPTALVTEHCRDLDLLVLESNHDVEMLRNGDYPPHLKARILSRIGHLSNEASAGLLDRVRGPRLCHVVLAHLSEANNEPELARLAAHLVLDGTKVTLAVAGQREPLRVPMAG